MNTRGGPSTMSKRFPRSYRSFEARLLEKKMNNITIADKLGLTGQVRELKLGRSFGGTSSNASNSPAFHTFRYDFKPASVDTSQVAQVDVEQRHQVSVTVPHHDSTSSTVFRGSQRPYQKECVLIIDHTTGELTLEKLSCNVQLKKTRAEGSSKVNLGNQGMLAGGSGRPLTPNPDDMPTVASLLISSSANPQQSNPSNNTSSVSSSSQSAGGKIKRPSPPRPNQRSHASPALPSGATALKQRISPVGLSNSSGMPPRAKPRVPIGVTATPVAPPTTTSSASLSANSMPMFLLDDSGRFDESALSSMRNASAVPMTTAPLSAAPLPAPANANTSVNTSRSHPPPAPPAQTPQDSNTDVVEMSEGSSSSSASSSGSSSEGDSSDSDSESDAEGGAAPSVPMNISASGYASGNGPATAAVRKPPNAPPPSSSHVTSSGFLQSSVPPLHHRGGPSMPQLNPTQASHASMLSEDLQLSESGSDSD